ncbi:hypothetical protein PLESTM_000974300 [Pleodorina starrii]|nr:hypothetical protein PLESTM_000974300 [Pleodorina starrii]
MAFTLTRQSAIERVSCAKRLVRQPSKRVCVVAASDDGTEPSTSGTVFYGGKSYTPEEWTSAMQSGSLSRPAAAVALPDDKRASTQLTFSDVMSFSGTAPEIVNGRLAMLGFVSAVAAEVASGEGVLRQWSEEPTGVALAFVLFIAGSLVTAFKPKRDEKLGPFTPQAELINGRAAM